MLDELNQQPAETPEVNQAAAPVEQQKESDKESNIRTLRERAEAAERRARELEYTMQQNMTQQKTTKMELVDDDDFHIDDDSLVEGKHFKKLYKKQSQELKEIKKLLEENTSKSTASNAEWRLKTQYTDFDSVVNEENIRKLASLKPALYRSMLSNPDLYDKGESAYDMIKSLVLTDKYSAQDKRIEENKSRPRSAASAGGQSGETPLAHIAEYDRRTLTEERKAQIRRMVQEAKMNG
jgi:hypothetical protein